MSQTRFSANTDETTARALMEPLEILFEAEGLPVSAFENPDAPGSWAISVYTATEDAEETFSRLSKLTKSQNVSLVFERDDIADQDWVAATLRDLAPVKAGRFMVHGSHDVELPKPHEIAVHVDAGLAFGTGHHGTTAGCLDMITRLAKSHTFYNVLDLGAGTGVLGIAAAKIWGANVLASDIDPVATRTASDNARLNGVAGRVECITSNGLKNRRFGERAPFDLVIANILARPLQSLALDIALHTMCSGKIILSGLLPHQQTQLVATFRNHGCVFEKAHHRDGWLTLIVRKP